MPRSVSRVALSLPGESSESAPPRSGSPSTTPRPAPGETTTLSDVLAELRAMRADLERLTAHPRDRPLKELVSIRVAALMLGVGRKKIRAMIKSGQLTEVRVGSGHPRLSTAGVRHVAVEGVRPTAPQSRKVRHSVSRDVGDQIRALPTR